MTITRTMRALLVGLLTLSVSPRSDAQSEGESGPLVITENTRFEAGTVIKRPIVVRGRGITIEGGGAEVIGPGVDGDPKTFIGTGVTVEGGAMVTIRNLKVSRFKLGIAAHACDGLVLEKCDGSNNQTDPEAGWNDERRAGGFHLSDLRGAVVRDCKARKCWNGIDLSACRDSVIENNDFSFCSNTAARLRLSSRNLIRGNNLSHGIRVKKGEAHARDSCGLMIESGSDANTVVGNDIRYGGDGIFVRISSGWISTGNRFIENDCSFAHNHGVECWSPGNIWIRNKANRCSYGFWMGGSDGSVMIGNEAGWNGLPDGNHNAPEAPFRHGGIVFVKGAAQHLHLEGNYCHDNGGPGIVIRGHRTDNGVDWPFFHVLIQSNRLENNRRGLWLEGGSFLEVRANIRVDNAEPDKIVDVRDAVIDDRVAAAATVRAPKASLDGPDRVRVNRRVPYSGLRSRAAPGAALSYRIAQGKAVFEGPRRDLIFKTPGMHRVALFVTNGRLSDLAWRDVFATDEGKGALEIGTEEQAAGWSFVMGADPEKKGRVVFTDDALCVEGRASIRIHPDPYMGRDVAAAYSFAARPLDLSKKTRLCFWLRYRNPNFWGFQGPNPVVRLLTREGFFTYTPTGKKGPRNLLWELPAPEGRYDWIRFSVPLAGGEGWTRTKEGEIKLARIQSLSFQFDSWGGDPFTIWLDGVRFE